MKTVAKTSLACLAAFAGLSLCIPASTWAQVAGSAVTAVAGSAQQVTDAAIKTDKTDAAAVPLMQPGAAGTTTPMPAVPGGMPQPMAMPAVQSPTIPVPAPSTSSAIVSSSSSVLAKNDGRANKVPDSVKDVMKRLGTASDNVTLEDLNAAREAVAKLDLLIDIEKRINDLTTLRAERDEKSGSSLAGAIPASALGLKNGPMSTQMPVLGPTSGGMPTQTSPISGMPGPISGMPSMGSVSSDGIDLTRVVGAAGNYVAYVKGGDGKAKPYHEGDKLPDGSVIKSISSHGMTVAKDKKTRVVKVKDISVVFNGR